MKYAFVLVLALTSLKPMMGQVDSLAQLTTDIISCRFYQNSLEMNEESKLVIEMIALDIKNKYVDKDPPSHPIIISSYYCQEEAGIDQFIGVKRAKIVLNYLIKNTDLSSNNFLIRDYDTRFKGNYSTVGCAFSSVSIYY
jgi:hypothetical protein